LVLISAIHSLCCVEIYNLAKEGSSIQLPQVVTIYFVQNGKKQLLLGRESKRLSSGAGESYTVISWFARGIGSRNPLRYQNLRI
jgi:hypothetical protein